VSDASLATGPSPARRSAALVLAGGVMLGSAGTASAFAPATATAPALGGLRLLVGSVALAAVLPLVGGTWRNLPRLLRRPTVWVMAAASAAYQPLFFGAVHRAGVAVSTLLAVGAVPVFAGLVGWAALAHRPTRVWLTATLVAVTGLALRCMGQTGLGDGPGLGVVMALTAAFGTSCYVVAAKAELDHDGHAAELPAAAYLLGSVMLAPLALTQPLAWVTTPSGLAVALYLGVVTMALGNVLAVAGMRSMPPGPASTLLLADPLTATLLGVLVLGETLPPDGVVGLLLVATGLLLQTRALGTQPKDRPLPEPAH
jgi:DME family drug/metabolite transporter